MIPVSLTLKNFMSYGEEGQTLSFEGIHVACLTGDNGNGKSALLDAITWSLWGKTRASPHGPRRVPPAAARCGSARVAGRCTTDLLRARPSVAGRIDRSNAVVADTDRDVDERCITDEVFDLGPGALLRCSTTGRR